MIKEKSCLEGSEIYTAIQDQIKKDISDKLKILPKEKPHTKKR